LKYIFTGTQDTNHDSGYNYFLDQNTGYSYFTAYNNSTGATNNVEQLFYVDVNGNFGVYPFDAKTLAAIQSTTMTARVINNGPSVVYDNHLDSLLPPPYLPRIWFQGTGSVYYYNCYAVPSFFRKKISGDTIGNINNSNVGINNQNQTSLKTLNNELSQPTIAGNDYLFNQIEFNNPIDNEYYSRR
jgi:hypothetical protein